MDSPNPIGRGRTRTYEARGKAFTAPRNCHYPTLPNQLREQDLNLQLPTCKDGTLTCCVIPQYIYLLCLFIYPRLSHKPHISLRSSFVASAGGSLVVIHVSTSNDLCGDRTHICSLKGCFPSHLEEETKLISAILFQV